jgi:FHS family Na+ dependent glucose MFS transporter 1
MLPVAVYIFSIPSPKSPLIVEDEDDTDAVQNRNRRNTLVAMIGVFFFLYVGAETSFGGWIATYAKTLGLGNAVTAAYLTSAFWGALTVGRFLSVILAVYFKPVTMLTIDLVGAIICMIILLLNPNSIVATWVGTIGTGLFMASIFPTTVNLAERRMTITGKVTAWFFVGGSLGGMTVPMIIGQFFEISGPRITPVAILSSMIAAAIVFGILTKSARSLSGKKQVVKA